MNASNRYLPAHLASRTRPLLVLLSLFLGVPIVTTLLAILLGPLAALFALIFGVGLFLAVVVPIFTAMGKLREVTQVALAGNANAVMPNAHYALRWVFRGDIRMNAFFLLGITAEANGDFNEASELFTCALSSFPMGNVASTKRRVGALISSHLALCAAGAGRALDSRNALTRAQHYLTIGPGAFDFLEGMNQGFTMNSDLEPGRDPRAIAVLAGIVAAHANGAHRDALDILTREAQTITYGLLPRERALASHLERRSRAALDGGGAMRQQSELAPSNPEEAWAARFFPRV